VQTISIITVVRNGAATIRDCINSVLEQTHPVEYLVIDGDSSDDTLSIVSQYGADIHRIIAEPDRGIYDAMNKGIALATGDVVGFLNADDFYAHTEVLSKVMEVFATRDTATCYGDLNYVDQIDRCRVVRSWRAGPFHPTRFYWGWMPPHPTFFARRVLYLRHAGFNLSLGSAADYELLLRFLVRYRVTTHYVPEVLVHMRTGGVSNANLRNRLRANQMDRKAWQVNGLRPHPWTLLFKPLRKLPQYIAPKIGLCKNPLAP
jgi:glycosyltransferase involved in cell wall biosynthesis